MSVEQICVRDVDLADPNESVWQAAERMHQRAVGTLVVLNDAQQPVGILTDRDLVERVLAEGKDAHTTTVGRVMTVCPKTVSEDASIESSLWLMRRGGFRRLPVVNRRGELVGLLSLDDVLMLMADEFRQIAKLLERETPSGVAAENVLANASEPANRIVQQFKRILVVVNTESVSQHALERAVELARHSGAALELVDVVREFSWLKRIAMPRYRELQQLLVEQKARALEQFASQVGQHELDVSTKVLTGRSLTEIVREVLHSGHDLVMKDAKGQGGFKGFFGATGTRLLRQCPCPVWIVEPVAHEKYKRVLAAVDVTSHDEQHLRLNAKILDLATSFCHWEQSQLDVVQAWSVYGETLLKEHVHDDEFDKLVEDHRRDVQRSFNELLNGYQIGADSPHAHLLHGDPGFVIPQFVRQEQIELIFMGTVARTGLAGALMENTAERILGKVECSVLAVKPNGFVSPISLD